MNILFLCNSFWPEGSGGQLATYLYSKLLAKNDISVRVISGTSERDKPTKETTEEGVTVLRIPSRGFGGGSKYSLAMKLPSLLFKSCFRRLVNWADVIYMTGWFPTIPLIKKIYEKPVVVHIHSYFPFCPIGSFYNLAENHPCQAPNSSSECFRCAFHSERTHGKSFLKALVSGTLNSTMGRKYVKFVEMADAVLFVSNAQRDLALECAPKISHKSKVIYNPIPDHGYIPVEGDDLGYFGGTSPLKGFRILMEAWSKVGSSHREKIRATNIEIPRNRASFKKIGVAPYKRLDENLFKNLYRKIRAVIVPSIYRETFGYVVTESLIRGRVAIASRVGGIPEIADGLEGVFLVDPGKSEELAGAIERVLSMNREEAEELGLKNREEILKKFDNSQIASEFLETLERLS